MPRTRLLLVCTLMCLLVGGVVANSRGNGDARKEKELENTAADTDGQDNQGNGKGDKQEREEATLAAKKEATKEEDAPDERQAEKQEAPKPGNKDGDNQVQHFSGKGKVTVISNKNTLDQMEAAPEKIDKNAVMEQHKKSEQEENQKRTSEENMKQRGEELKKKERAAEDKREEAREEAKKKELTNKAKREAAEEDNKAKHKKQAQETAAKRKQQGVQEENAKAKEAQQKKHQSAQEKQQKANQERAEKAAAEQKKKNNGLRLQHPWRNYGGGYMHVGAWKQSSQCFLTGLARGHNGMVGHLPTHCRPVQGRLIFTGNMGNRNARIDVLADGRIYHVVAGGGHWLSLNGIQFDTHIRSGIQLHNGWRPYSHGYRSPTMSTAHGLCMMSGLLRGHHWGYIGRVGGSCYPDRRLIFTGNNHGGITRLDVLPNGHFIYAEGHRSHGWVALDGMAYTRAAGTALHLVNGWRNYHHSYRVGSWAKAGAVCSVSGLITANRWHHHITTLPPGCRPAQRLIFGTRSGWNSYVRIDVLPDGRVLRVAGGRGHNWLSLSGIVFHAQR